MPNVTVYIRKEDMDKWRALEDKSQAISKLLNSVDYPVPEPKNVISTKNVPQVVNILPDDIPVADIKPDISKPTIIPTVSYLMREGSIMDLDEPTITPPEDVA